MAPTVERYTITPPERFTIAPPSEQVERSETTVSGMEGSQFTITPPRKPLPYRILDILGQGVSELGEGYTAAANLFRGLVTGQPGKQVTAPEVFGAERALEERGPLAATIRDVAGALVDPLVLGGPLIGGVKRAVGAARTVKPPPTPIPPPPPTPVEHVAAGKWVIKPTTKEVFEPLPSGFVVKPTTKAVLEPIPSAAQGPTGRFVQEPEGILGTPAAEFKGPVETPTAPPFRVKIVEGEVYEPLPSGFRKKTVEGGTWVWQPDTTVTRTAYPKALEELKSGMPNLNPADPADIALRTTAKGQAQPPLPPPVTSISAELPLNQPIRLTTQVSNDAYTALAKLGPTGERAAGIRRQLEDVAEQGASQIKTDFEHFMDRTWGRRSGMDPKRLNPFSDVSMEKLWHITEPDKRNLVDVLYSEGRLAPINERVAKTAQFYFEKGTRPVSARAGEAQLEVLQADGSKIPVGSPTMFMPQQPVAPKLKQIMEPQTFNRLFNAAHARNPNLTKTEFRQHLQGYHATGPFEVATRYRGLENARTFDASVGGTESAYTNLKRFGYETDPYRALVRYAAKGLLRAEEKLASPELSLLQEQLAKDLPGTKWPQTVIERLKGSDIELMDKVGQGLFSTVMQLNNARLLQLATLGNLNQVIYTPARAGVLNTVKAMFTKDADEIAKRSGALFTNYMHDMSQAKDALGHYVQAQFRASGFSPADRVLRGLAAKTGDFQAQQYANRLMANPSDARARAVLKELRLDPDDIIQAGGLQMHHRLRAAQVFANETQGRATLQGLPLWAADNHPLAQSLLQYKRFLLNNATEMIRTIGNAPDFQTGLARAFRLGVGAEIVGELTKDASFLITHLESPFEPQRVSKPLREKLGPVAGRLVDNAIYSVASIPFALAASAIQGRSQFLEFLAGPTLAGVAQVATSPIQTGLRALPGPLGPIAGRAYTRPEPKVNFAPLRGFDLQP